MKVTPVNHLKYQGEYYLPGVELELSKKDAEVLLQTNRVTMVGGKTRKTTITVEPPPAEGDATIEEPK